MNSRDWIYYRRQGASSGAGGGVSTKRPPVGLVRVNGRDLEDDGGSLNALGCTLFPAPWAEKHDVPRLERAFATLAAGPYQFYRSGTGFQPISWEDRLSDPADVDTVIRMAERGWRHGLRAWHCLFMDGSEAAGAETASQRREIVEQWAAKLAGHESKFLALEIVNEGGAGGKMPVSEIRILGAFLQSRTSVPIILTDTRSNQEWIDLYRGSGMKLATQHFERDDSADGGRFEHLSKMAEFPVEPVDPTACMSGEPKGPGSSGQSEWNVNRLVLGYVCTLIEGCAGYVFHPGPGIRLGGAHDRHRLVDGRPIPEHLDELPEWRPCTDGFRAARSYLPAGVANWRRWKGHHTGSPLNFRPYRNANPAFPDGLDNGPFDDSTIFKSYIAVKDSQLIATVLRLRKPLAIIADQVMELQAIDAVTGEPFQSARLSVGQSFTLTPRAPSGDKWDGDGFVLKGALQ